MRYPETLSTSADLGFARQRCCEACLPDPPGCCGIAQDVIATNFPPDDKCPICKAVAAHFTVRPCGTIPPRLLRGSHLWLVRTQTDLLEGHITCTFCWKAALLNLLPECVQCDLSDDRIHSEDNWPITNYHTSQIAYPDLRPREAWLDKPKPLRVKLLSQMVDLATRRRLRTAL